MAQQNPAVQAYVTAVNAQLTRFSTGLDGVTGDVTNLKAQLEAIQNSPGVLSPEDQASLDAALATTTSLADRVSALDDATDPVAPPAP